MGNIYKNRETSQFTGGLNLSGISNLGKQAERSLDERGEKLKAMAQDTYKKESIALARSSMADSFLKNKESPDALMADFNITKNKIAETILDDESKIDFLANFEIASAPYVRSSKKAFEVKTSNKFNTATRNSVSHNLKTLIDNASVQIASDAEENPEAYADFQIIKNDIKEQVKIIDPITGKQVYTDSEQKKILDQLENGVQIKGVLDTQTNILRNQGTAEAISYSKNVLETSANDMGVSTDAKKELDDEIEIFLDNPKVDAEQLKYKTGIAAEVTSMSNALYEGAIDKPEASASMMEINQAIEVGFSNGMIDKNDKKMIKAQTLIRKNLGKNVLSKDAFKGSSSSVGALFQDFAGISSKQNDSLAGELYMSLNEISSKEGLNVNSTSKDDQNKAKKIIQEVQRDQIDKVTSAAIFSDKPNAVLQLNGELNEYDPESSTGGYLTIGIFGGE